AGITRKNMIGELEKLSEKYPNEEFLKKNIAELKAERMKLEVDPGVKEAHSATRTPHCLRCHRTGPHTCAAPAEGDPVWNKAAEIAGKIKKQKKAEGG
ncbi:MAG: hypothetical protein Q8O19_02230, partial [Rectinemataceae bacterium]|nr:hypothetical protein [Rectinemataceae bacterium]